MTELLSIGFDVDGDAYLRLAFRHVFLRAPIPMSHRFTAAQSGLRLSLASVSREIAADGLEEHVEIPAPHVADALNVAQLQAPHGVVNFAFQASAAPPSSRHSAETPARRARPGSRGDR